MLVVLLLSLLTGPQSASAFSDVHTTAVHFDAITYVQAQGIVSGYADGTFRADASINRAEFTKIIITATGKNVAGSNCFPDVNNEWFAGYVCSARELGMISGYPDGTFRPEQTISFVEASKIIARAFALEEPQESSAWYAPFVLALEAHNAIPLQVQQFSQSLTRAQMAEIIFRLHSGNTDLPSQTFSNLGGIITQTHTASSARSSVNNTEPEDALNDLPFSPVISADWQEKWEIVEIEGTKESLKNVEVKEDDAEFGNFFRVHFPKGSGSRFVWKFYGKPLGGFISWIDPRIVPTHEIYLRYYVRFPDGFDFNSNGTLPGIFTGVSNGRQEESAATIFPYWESDGMLKLGGDFRDGIENSSMVHTSGELLGDGKWHRIDFRAKLQTAAGKSNGLIEAWLDGEHIGISEDILFQNRVGDLWDALAFVAAIGDISVASVVSADTHIDFAGFTFSNKRIP